MKGIYAYFDTEKNRFVYVGLDSNIDRDHRHRDHMAPSMRDAQPFNRVLQNNPERYTYCRLIELSDDFDYKVLADLERFYIGELHTFYYDNNIKMVDSNGNGY